MLFLIDVDLLNKYSVRFNECHFSKKNCFKMNVVLHFQYNFNFFLTTLPSINTSTFLSHNLQCNFKFVFFLSSLVKVLCLMIISLHSLIYVQLAKTTLILKWGEYIIRREFGISFLQPQLKGDHSFTKMAQDRVLPHPNFQYFIFSIQKMFL